VWARRRRGATVVADNTGDFDGDNDGDGDGGDNGGVDVQSDDDDADEDEAAEAAATFLRLEPAYDARAALRVCHRRRHFRACVMLYSHSRLPAVIYVTLFHFFFFLFILILKCAHLFSNPLCTRNIAVRRYVDAVTLALTVSLPLAMRVAGEVVVPAADDVTAGLSASLALSHIDEQLSSSSSSSSSSSPSSSSTSSSLMSADQSLSPADLKKRLWLLIARDVVAKNDMHAAMRILARCSDCALRIEDLLPIFPDFVRIGDLKAEICTSLEAYNRRYCKRSTRSVMIFRR
jgi:hypothetical protein